MKKKQERHILALSGGKDSAALAVYMREKYPEIPLEYVFIDSGCELPETYDYLNKIRAILNIKIKKIGGADKKDRRDFKWWLKEKNDYLPSLLNRWCTEVLKLKPYSKWLRENCPDSIIHSYVGLRADEKRDRKGYLDKSGTIVTHHPFIEDTLVYDDIKFLLENSAIGFPSYYKWRTRSGCYFCFYQTKHEWIGLYDNHKDLFLDAASMEKIDSISGKKFTWCEDMSLVELIARREEIEKQSSNTKHGKNKIPKLCSSLRFSYENIDVKKTLLTRGKCYDIK
jgi:hypothetical protein